MNPTFRTGDRLYIVPYQNRRIRRGDVIIFELPVEKRRIVHRVISILATGVRTRGDHNRFADPYLLQPDQIIGRVVSFQRGKKQRKALNGVVGLLYHHMVTLFYFFLRTVILLFRPFYRFLRHSKLLAKIFPIHFNTKLVSFQKNGVSEYQLLWHGHIIGRRSVSMPTWQLKHFFLLWIDEKSLP